MSIAHEKGVHINICDFKIWMLKNLSTLFEYNIFEIWKDLYKLYRLLVVWYLTYLSYHFTQAT